MAAFCNSSLDLQPRSAPASQRKNIKHTWSVSSLPWPSGRSVHARRVLAERQTSVNANNDAKKPVTWNIVARYPISPHVVPVRYIRVQRRHLRTSSQSRGSSGAPGAAPSLVCATLSRRRPAAGPPVSCILLHQTCFGLKRPEETAVESLLSSDVVPAPEDGRTHWYARSEPPAGVWLLLLYPFENCLKYQFLDYLGVVCVYKGQPISTTQR